MTEPDPWDEEYEDMGDGTPGCCNCGYNGWVHGCCDDLCRGSNEAVDCSNSRPCRNCNPKGEWFP